MKDNLTLAIILFIIVTMFLTALGVARIKATKTTMSFYSFSGSTDMPINDIKYLQDKYGNDSIQIGNANNWNVDNVNILPISYSFYSWHSTELNSKLVGEIAWYNVTFSILALMLWITSGHYIIKHLPSFIKGWRLDESARKKRLNDVIYPLLNSYLLPEDKAEVLTTVPDSRNYDIDGIIGYREWNIKRIGNNTYKLSALKVGSSKEWRFSITISNHQPSIDNDYGLYSKMLSSVNEITTINIPKNTITGIVENRGIVIEHEDGILRADCCRILFFILNKQHFQNYAEGLSCQYHVPVVIADNDYITLNNWKASMIVHNTSKI